VCDVAWIDCAVGRDGDMRGDVDFERITDERA
jgi:hypothetical protein